MLRFNHINSYIALILISCVLIKSYSLFCTFLCKNVALCLSWYVILRFISIQLIKSIHQL